MSKIMVIEEDYAMRTLISEWLTAEGHEVGSLSRPGSAPGSAVDLVILDLPQLRSHGGEISRVVKEVAVVYPSAAVIGISTRLGRSLEAHSGAARAFGVDRVLAKPCSREELLGAVADIL
ncbi:MAG: hypothetical protein ABW220_14060 [Burkholderiaceae bacterium]